MSQLLYSQGNTTVPTEAAWASELFWKWRRQKNSFLAPAGNWNLNIWWPVHTPRSFKTLVSHCTTTWSHNPEVLDFPRLHLLTTTYSKNLVKANQMGQLKTLDLGAILKLLTKEICDKLDDIILKNVSISLFKLMKRRSLSVQFFTLFTSKISSHWIHKILTQDQQILWYITKFSDYLELKRMWKLSCLK